MAKVYGPLHSDDARGKLASSLVFIGWKGIKTVRQWVIPANPKSVGQGNVRKIIGNLGRVVGKVAKDSAFHGQFKDLDLIPDRQSKQSYLVQYIKDNYFAGKGATMKSNYEAAITGLAAADASNAWGSGAVSLGLTAFDLDYDDITNWRVGLGLYLLAKAAVALELQGAPYTAKAPASWTAPQIQAMVADMTGTG